jgi:hypothetical protein
VAGTTVTIAGSGFGASQGSGIVWLGSTNGDVVSWSDAQVAATVDPNAKSGTVRIQQNGIWSNALRFIAPTVGSTNNITMVPNSVSMLVGETRTIQALNSSGAAVFAKVNTAPCDGQPLPNGTSPTYNGPAGSTAVQISYVSGNGLASQVNVSLPGSTFVVPTLQREDGSYIAADLYGNVYAIGIDGSIMWQQLVSPTYVNETGTPAVTPLYATADGGVIATNTTQCSANLAPPPALGYAGNSNPPPCAPWSTSGGGTLYTLDQNGSVTSQRADTGAVYSWTDQWYDPQPNAPTVSAVTLPAINLAPSFWALLGGNQSSDGSAAPESFFPGLGVVKESEIYNALSDLVSRLMNPGINSLADSQIFIPLNNKYHTGVTANGFISYLGGRTPRFYNGLISNYCYNTLTNGDTCFSPGRFSSWINYLNSSTVAEQFAANPKLDALTAKSTNPLLTFFNVSSILDASQGKNLGNEAMIFHEALHGKTGLSDPQLLEFFNHNGVDTPPCNISKKIEQLVLSQSSGLDQTTNSGQCTLTGP